MTREPRLFLPALWRLALAGGVFLLIYGACNQITATRHDVGTWMWEWERHIPFIPEMVIPYWSLDLLFCGAFFLCSSKVELNLLTKRLLAVVILSGACFLLFPLKMGVVRPVPSGWTAPLFYALYFNDLPYNLAPSLHISLRSLIWVFYGAHLTGWLRKAGKVWFMLIGVSTLLIWQHHVIDVATGFLMGWFVTVIIPDPRQPDTHTPSRKLALRYGGGAVVCTALSFAWFVFAWPATALGIVALAYLTGRSSVLGKQNGCLSPSSEWCLLPYLAGAWLYQRKWLKAQPGWREISPGVFFGRKPSPREAAELTATGDLAVLDLTAESNAPAAFRENGAYFNLPLLDLVPPPPDQIELALAFIELQTAFDRRVYIQCQLGLQRSATIAAHWLVEAGHEKNLPTAIAAIRALHPGVVL
jgi:hypothetical protein